MATIALTAVGTAFGGPVGGAIGAAVGSYIDQQFIMPALFPPDPIEGQSIQELRIQGSDEGYPLSRIYGQKTRVAGVIIWTPKTFHKRTETDTVGGKGGGGQKVKNHFYSVDLAISFGEGEIASIDRLYADTKLIYDATPSVAISSNLLSASSVGRYHTRNDRTGGSTQTLTNVILTIESPTTGPDLSELINGNAVVIAGWTDSTFNGTFVCIANDKRDDKTSWAKFRLGDAASVGSEAAGNTITLNQSNPTFFSGRMEDLTLYTGTETQTKDSLITGVDGAENTSAYRGICYVVIEKLELEKFSNRIPNFTADVFRGSSDELDDTIDDILADSDLDAAEWDATALAGIASKGYATRGPIPTVTAFQPLTLAYDFLAQNVNGVLTFFQRENATVITVDEDDLAAHTANGDDSPWPDQQDRKAGIEPPAEVLVKYLDEENSLQPGEELERNMTAINLFEKKTVQLNITMNGGEARDIAARLIFGAKLGQIEHTIAVPPSYITILENDIIQYVSDGETYRFLAQDVTDGADGVRVVTGFGEMSANSTQSSPHDEPDGSPGQTLEGSYDVTLEVIDVGPLQVAAATTPGLYVAASSLVSNITWEGASLYESDDSGVTWGLKAVLPTEAIVGYTDAALPAGLNHAHWDRGSTLEVIIPIGTLSSVTELECLNGANRAIVGGEIIGYQNATLSAVQPGVGTKYDLTKLLRGLSGTELDMAQHVAGDRFVALSPDSIFFVEYGTGSIGATRLMTAVSPGGDPDDFEQHTVDVQAQHIKPLAVVHVFATLNDPATNDWTLTWTARSRSFFRIFAQAPPQLEPTEDFIVEVYNSGGTLINTYTSTLTASGSGVTGSSFVYDAADQTTDFGSTQSTIYVRIYQVSNLATRGKTTGTLTFS